MDDHVKGGDGAASYAVLEPSYDELCADVAQVRRRGAGNADKPLTDLCALLWAARIVSQRLDDAEQIEDALEQASKRLADRGAKVIPLLLGLVPETRGHGVAFRRKTAAEGDDYKSVDSFRTHHENPLLMALATQLLALVSMKRVADREDRLVAQQRKLSEDLKDFNEKQKELVADYLPITQLRRQMLEAMTVPLSPTLASTQSQSVDPDGAELDKGVRAAFRRRRQK